MALDHYVPQVHLKNFYSPAENEKKMYGVQKRTLRQFPCGSEDVCRIEEGNSNPFLVESRAIEEFLTSIEPNYNRAVGRLRDGEIDGDDVLAIAGFVSYILSCSPASVRLTSNWLSKVVESTITAMDSTGAFGDLPKELGDATLTELLENGKVISEIDKKYPHALGVEGIIDRTQMFGNFKWDILINEVPDSPFFTSDFPVAIEQSEHPNILNRLVPLAPDLAIRIRPNPDVQPDKEVMDFADFGYRRIKANHKQVRYFNKLIVQCAEEHVYFRDDNAWVLPFIKKNASYWVEPLTERVPAGDGEYIVSTLRVAPRP